MVQKFWMFQRQLFLIFDERSIISIMTGIKLLEYSKSSVEGSCKCLWSGSEKYLENENTAGITLIF